MASKRWLELRIALRLRRHRASVAWMRFREGPGPAKAQRPQAAPHGPIVLDDLSPDDYHGYGQPLTELPDVQDSVGPEPQDAAPPDPARQDHPDRAARLFPPTDPFGSAVRDALGPVLFADGVLALLAHCGTVTKVRPTHDWLRRTDELLTDAPAAPRALAGLLEAACAVPAYDTVGPLLTGAAWAACVSGDTVAILALGAAVRRRSRPSRRQPRWVRAGLDALATAAGQSSASLPRHRAPDGAAHDIRDLARTQLAQYYADRAAPPEDWRGVRIGPYMARVVVRSSGAPAMEFREAAGPVLSSIPKEVRREFPGPVAELTARHAAVRERVGALRERLTADLAARTPMPVREWRSDWLDDEVAGPLCGALVWEVRMGDHRTATGLPVRDSTGWKVLEVTGVSYAVPDGASVRLFQPTPPQAPWVARLQSLLVERGLSQPIPQLAARAGRAA